MEGVEFDVSITCSSDDNEEIPLYTATWVWNEVVYQITGRLELNELEKIIQQIKF
jgi:hypothetical protein